MKIAIIAALAFTAWTTVPAAATGVQCTDGRWVPEMNPPPIVIVLVIVAVVLMLSGCSPKPAVQMSATVEYEVLK